MSSGFVSGGTIDAPIERSDEWIAAQTEIEANRARKAAEAARQHDVAKQEAFEEANRLKNQFQTLNEDEIEFLDSVLESTRREEERVKKETREGLEAFRKQQEEADKKAREGATRSGGEEGPPVIGEEQWAAGGRKRKRKVEKEVLKGVKVRRSSSTLEASTAHSPVSTTIKKQENNPAEMVVKATQEKSKESKAPPKPQSTEPTGQTKPSLPPPKTTSPPKSSLVNYGSDEDDDW